MGCGLLALWSCGLDDSAVVQIDDGDASTTDGSTFDVTTDVVVIIGDTGTNDTGITDSGIPDTGPCPTTDLPICDNGSCGSASEVCTPPIGSGWTVVNYISGSRPACSAGYSAPHDVVEVTDGGPSSCACNCATTGSTPTCENAHLHLGLGGATCTDVTEDYDMTAGCNDLSGALGLTNAQATVSIAAANTCAGETDASFPNPDGGLSRECPLDPDAGASNLCANHRACVAKPASGNVCIMHAAPATCPSGFTEKNVADTFTDSRSCPSCACGWSGTGCPNPVVSAYTVPACTATATTIPAACGAVASPGPFASFGVGGTDVTPTCGVTDAGALDGGVAITNSDVICCSN